MTRSIHVGKMLSVLPLLAVVAAVLALGAGAAPAGTYTWDQSGGPPLDDGSGNWNATGGTNWFDGVATYGAWGNTTADVAVFGVGSGAAGTITVGTVDANGITFNAPGSGNYVVTGGTITLGGTTPTITANANGTISSILAGSGLTKTGAGALTLTGVNTYAGSTTVNAGTLQIGNGSSAGSISGSSAVVIAGGATMAWNYSDTATHVIANTVSGTGTLLLQGGNGASTLQNGLFDLTGNNSGFSGTLRLSRSMMWNTTSANEVGTATIDVGNQATFATNAGMTLANNFTIEAGAGWHNNVGGDVVIGALRLENSPTLTGNITLNTTTSIVNGDNSGANSVISAWTASNSTLSGVISGPGDLAMSRFTSWNGGAVQTVNITLSGAASNTYLGKTVVDGQGAIASLILAKTGGAVAIPANTTVQMGSATGGQANLRMGGNEQFGSGVVMNFVNVSGQWMRFDLKGTTQTLAGMNAGTASTQAGAIVQNQGIDVVDPGADATLTLNGSGTYLYNGYIRDQDNSGTTRKINLVHSGTGSQTLVGGAINYTGSTTVNSGTLTLSNTPAYRSSTTINTPGVLEMNVPSGTLTVPASYSISGNGTLLKTGAGTWVLGANGIQVGMTMAAGGLVDIEGGTVQNNFVRNNWITNLASMKVASGAVFDMFAENVQIDALTGGGTVQNSYAPNGVKTLTIGAAGGSGLFSGTVTNAGGNIALVKIGAGTQTLTGNNTYSGGTTVNAGVLSVASIADSGSSGIGNSGNLNMNGGTIQYTGSGSQSTARAVPAAGGGAFTFEVTNAAANLTVSGAISSAGAFTMTKTGAGTLTLAGSANNTWLEVAVNNGTLVLAKDSTAANVALDNVTINGGAMVQLAGTGGNQIWGGVTSNGGTFDLGGRTETIAYLSGSGTVTNSAAATLSTLTVDSNASTVFAGTIQDGAGTVALIKTNTNPFYLDGANTYSGQTTVSGGYLVVRNNNALGTTAGGTLVNSGATLQMEHATGITITGEALTLNGNGVGGNRGTLGNWSGNNVWAGPVTLASDSLIYVNTGSLTISGAIGGSANLTKTGGGPLILSGSGANTYTGTTTVNGTGTFAVPSFLVLSKSANVAAVGGNVTMVNDDANVLYTTADNQFAAGSVLTMSGGTNSHARFELEGTTQTLAGVVNDGTGRGVIQNRELAPANTGASTLVLNGSGTYSFNGYVRNANGTLGIVKNGTGTQTFSGGNITYTGATTVNNGTLALQDTTGFGSPITVNAGGTLTATRTALGIGGRSPIMANGITGSGIININNAGSGAAGGWTTVNGGTGSLNFSGTINVNSGVFSRDNTQVDTITGTATVNVAAGAVFGAGRGGNSTIGPLNGAGDVSTLWGGANPGSLTLGNGGGSGSFSGVIHGNGTNGADGTLEGGILSLIKVGAGTQTLTGANTYSGKTTISGGTLQVGNGGTTGNLGTGAVVDNASLVFNRSNAITVTNPISGTGSLTQNGSGTLTLAGVNTYSGATTISGGTLKLQAPATTFPSSIAGLMVQLDATNVTGGGNPPNGTQISTWVNMASGPVGNFTQNGASAPYLNWSGNLMNGLPVVHFWGGLLQNTYNFGNDVTVMYAGRMDGGANQRLVSSTANNWLLGYWGGGMNRDFWNGSPQNLTGSGGADYNSHIFIGTADGTTAWSYNADGTEVQWDAGALGGGGQGPNGLALGGWGSGGLTELSYSDIGEVLVFNRALTATERQQMEQYLQGKWYGVLPGSTAVNIAASGATLDLNGVNQTVGSLAGVNGSGVLLNGAWLTVGQDGTSTTFSGAIGNGTTSGGGLSKIGSGTLTLAGSSPNTYTGPTVISQGQVGLSKTAGVTAIPGDIRMVNSLAPTLWMGADNQLGGSGVLTFVNEVNAFINNGNARFDLEGTTQTLAGIVETDAYRAGVIQNSESAFGGPNNTGTGTLVLSGSGNYSYNGYLRNVSGTLSVIMNGTGTQTLNLNSNQQDRMKIGTTYWDLGAFTVNSGVVNIQNTYIVFGESGGGLAQYTQTGGTVNHTGAGGVWISNGTGAPSQMTITGGTFNDMAGGSMRLGQSPGGATLTVNGSGAVMNLGGEMWIGQNYAGTVNLNAGTINQSGQFFVVGNAAEGGTYNQTGGTYNFTGVNGSYIGNGTSGTGTMTVSGGTFTQTQNVMRVGQNGTSFGILNIGGGAGTAVVSAPTVTFGANSAGAAGTVNLLANGILNTGTVNRGPGTGTFNFNGGTLQASANNGNFMGGLTAANVQSGGAIIDSQSFNIALNQPLLNGGGGGGGLTKVGSGTLTLTAGNTYTGATNVLAGTVKLPATTPIAGMALWLDASDKTTLYRDLGGTQQVSAAGDTVAMWKDKSGNLRNATQVTFANQPTYQSGVQNGQSVVRLDATNDGMATPLTVTGGGLTIFTVYDFNGTDTTGFHRAIQGSNNWLMGPYTGRNSLFAGNWVGTGPNVTQSQFVIQTAVESSAVASNFVNGSLYGSLGGPAYPGTIALGMGAFAEPLNGDIAEVLVYTSTLSDSDRVAVESYLRYKWMNSTVLPTSTAVTVAGGATLDLNGVSSTIGSLAGAAGSSVTLGGATLTTGNNNTTTSFAGTISGNGGLVKIGSGAFTLAGANTYAGPTTVNAGKLLVDGSIGTAGSPTTVTVNGGMLGGNGTINGAVNVAAAGTVSAGDSPGHLIVNGAFNLSGTMLAELGGTDQGTGYDWIEVNGVATLASGSIVDVNAWNNWPSPGEGQPYYVLTATGGINPASLAGITFDFSGAPIGPGEWKASVVPWPAGGSNAEALMLEAVPEPATMGLLGLALTGLVGYLRRRRAV